MKTYHGRNTQKMSFDHNTIECLIRFYYGPKEQNPVTDTSD